MPVTIANGKVATTRNNDIVPDQIAVRTGYELARARFTFTNRRSDTGDRFDSWIQFPQVAILVMLDDFDPCVIWRNLVSRRKPHAQR
jgi:hypothetical protein